MRLLDNLRPSWDSVCGLSFVWPRSGYKSLKDRYTQASRGEAAQALFIDSSLKGRFQIAAHPHLINYVFARRAGATKEAAQYLQDFKDEIERQNVTVSDEEIEAAVSKAQALLVRERMSWTFGLF